MQLGNAILLGRFELQAPKNSKINDRSISRSHTAKASNSRDIQPKTSTSNFSFLKVKFFNQISLFFVILSLTLCASHPLPTNYKLQTTNSAIQASEKQILMKMINIYEFIPTSFTLVINIKLCIQMILFTAQQ